MSGDGARGLAESCLVETAEGPVSMRETPQKGFAVMTRLLSGELGFRQLIRLEHVERAPLVRVSLDNGHAFVVARDHPVYRIGLEATPAGDLAPGDSLESAFRYPDGYQPSGAEAPSAWGIHVTAVEPAGEGAVMFGTVRDSHRLFLTAGVLCGE
jgi:hypothetical protein